MEHKRTNKNSALHVKFQIYTTHGHGCITNKLCGMFCFYFIYIYILGAVWLMMLNSREGEWRTENDIRKQQIHTIKLVPKGKQNNKKWSDNILNHTPRTDPTLFLHLSSSLPCYCLLVHTLLHCLVLLPFQIYYFKSLT